MDTTTPVDGGDKPQPTAPVTTGQPTEAVEELAGNEMVITTDENGTPTMVPLAQQPTEETTEPETPTEPDAQATDNSQQAEASDKTDDEIASWAEKKGLKIDPANPNEIRLARMQLENDRKFIGKTEPKIQPPEPLEQSDNETINQLTDRLNRQEQLSYVETWFTAHPEMREHRTELAKIAGDRTYLSDMDDVAAHFWANPNREAELRKQGGREALQNLAQKQAAVPPQAAATRGTLPSDAITSRNVDAVVAAHMGDPKWYASHRNEIDAALSQ